MLLWFLLLVAASTSSQWSEVGNRERFDYGGTILEFRIYDYQQGFKIRLYGDSYSFLGFLELRLNAEGVWKHSVEINDCSRWNKAVSNNVPANPDTIWRIWIGTDKFNLKADGVKIASKECGTESDIKQWEIEVFEPVSNLMIQWRPADADTNAGM